MIPRAYFWNNLRLRPVRTMLTILSVAGAVASVIAVLQSTAATQIQVNSLHTTLASPVDMEIIAADTTAFSLDDVNSVLASSDVHTIPAFRVFTKVVAGDKEARCLTTGVDIDEYRQHHDLTIKSGTVATNAGEVCVATSVAEHLGIRPGDEVKIGAKGLPWLVTKTVSGIFEFSSVDRFNETTAILTTLSDASKLGRSPGKINSLQLILKDKSSESAVRDQISKALPSNLVIAKSSSAAALSGPTEAMIGVGLNVAALLSVIAAVFIVFNSFQMSVAERQRQIAIMRIVGATSDQVRYSLYREALLLAVVGTLLGVLPGVYGGGSIESAMREAMGFDKMAPVPLRRHAIVIGLLFGPLVTIISVWFPARFACQAAPLNVLKGTIHRQRRFTRKTGAVTCGVSLGLAVIFFGCVSLEFHPRTCAIFAIAAIEIACAFALPELIQPLSSVYYRMMRCLGPVESLLGHRQLLDNFGRTSLTVAVLFVVSATSIAVGCTTLAVTRNVEAWIDRTLDVDFILMASRPSIDMSDAQSLPEELGRRIRAMQGIRMVDEVSFCLASVNGSSALLSVQQFDAHQTIPIDLLDGNAIEVREQLRNGEVLLGSVLANLLKVKPGDFVSVEVKGAAESLRVAGIIREYTAGGLTLQMDTSFARERFSIPATQVFGACADDTSRSAVEQSLRELAKEYGLIFQSMADLKTLVRTMATGITSRLFMILVLALVIAGFAIVNSLTMNVIEQTRYLGLLRVVGMLRSQAFRMFLLQALIVGIIGILPGIAVGVLLSYLTTMSFGGVTDHEVQFHADPSLILAYAVSGLLLSILAAVIPAARASQLRPLEAIYDE